MVFCEILLASNDFGIILLSVLWFGMNSAFGVFFHSLGCISRSFLQF